MLRVRPTKNFVRETRRKVWCCSRECAYQAAFLQLETRSTRDTITRLLGGKPITYQQFRRLPLEIFEGRSDRTETPSEVTDSIDTKTAKNEFMALPHREPISVRENNTGKPRKWNSEKDRLRSYRDRQRSKMEASPR